MHCAKTVAIIGYSSKTAAIAVNIASIFVRRAKRGATPEITRPGYPRWVRNPASAPGSSRDAIPDCGQLMAPTAIRPERPSATCP